VNVTCEVLADAFVYDILAISVLVGLALNVALVVGRQ
jgi:hypothetical protein